MPLLPYSNYGSNWKVAKVNCLLPPVTVWVHCTCAGLYGLVGISSQATFFRRRQIIYVILQFGYLCTNLSRTMSRFKFVALSLWIDSIARSDRRSSAIVVFRWVSISLRQLNVLSASDEDTGIVQTILKSVYNSKKASLYRVTKLWNSSTSNSESISMAGSVFSAFLLSIILAIYLSSAWRSFMLALYWIASGLSISNFRNDSWDGTNASTPCSRPN